MNHPATIATSAMQFFNNVETTADQIISELPDMDDLEVLQLRMQARTFGRVAWRIECACDALILSRESARRGRLKGEEGKGIDAAVKKHALEIGVSPRTIYSNAAIHKTFFASASACRNKEENGSLDDLSEREFYNAALSTDDPHAMLEKFAEEKVKNPFFSTRDAWRMVKESKTPPLDTVVPALCDEPKVVEAWEGVQLALRKLITTAPRLQNVINGYLEELQYELTLPSQTVEEVIFGLLEQGFDEPDEIAARMKKDRIFVIVWLNRLVEIGKLEAFYKERAPGARGAARQGFREIIE